MEIVSKKLIKPGQSLGLAMLGELAPLKRKVLPGIERAMYDISVRDLNIIKSKKLLGIIQTIVEKLKRILKSPVSARYIDGRVLKEIFR